MKLLKSTLIIITATLLLTSCKEAVDKRKDATQTINNTLTAIVKNVNAQDFNNLIKTSTESVILDVRTPQEFQSGHITGAINIDWKNQPEFTKNIKTLTKDKTILVYCHSGHRSGLATQFLKEQGYQKIYNLESGIMGWKAANFTVEK